MTRPIIGITKPERGDNFAYLSICVNVWWAGGRPLKLSTGMSWRKTDIDGLIIGGGSDVFPPHYGQEAIETARYDKGRDEMEMYWARKARDHNIATLAICRGAQIMNVAGGGSLYQNLSDVNSGANYPTSLLGNIFFRKAINITPTSLLEHLLGRARTQVNSIHKQAIATVAEGLKVTAIEDNGLVQAVEDPDKQFYLGLQFHPEFLTYRRPFRRIFRELVCASLRP